MFSSSLLSMDINDYDNRSLNIPTNMSMIRTTSNIESNRTGDNDHHNYQMMILSRLDQMDKRFNQIDKRFNQMDKRFNQMDKRFNQMDKRFDRIETKVDDFTKKLDKIIEHHHSSSFIENEKNQSINNDDDLEQSMNSSSNVISFSEEEELEQEVEECNSILLTSDDDSSIVSENFSVDNNDSDHSEFILDNNNDSSLSNYDSKSMKIDQKNKIINNDNDNDDNDGIEKLACSKCSFKFDTPQQLLRHHRTHRPNHRLICYICGNRFQFKSYLDQHLLVHSGAKPYECKQCHYATARQFVYIHLIDHTNAINVDIDIIHKKNSKFILSVGILLMINKKKHQCNICSKAFTLKYNLQRHKLIHTDERPFGCQYCHQRFRRKDSLQNHIKSKHS